MLLGLTRIADPVTEPVTLAEMRQQCRVDAVGSPPAHEDDALLGQLVTDARTHIELLAGRSLMPQTWRIVYGVTTGQRWGGPRPGATLALLRGPVTAVTSVRVRAEDGTETEVPAAAYAVWLDPSWPHLRVRAGFPALGADECLVIEYRAGYLNNDSPPAPAVPASLTRAIKLLAAYWYGQRESSSEARLADVPFGVEALVAPYRAEPMA